MKRSMARWLLLFSLILPVALHAEEPTSLLVSSVLADSSLVAPVASYRYDNGDGTAYRVGISGWTLDGEWSRRRSERHSLVFAVDATPMNARSSNLTYEDGVRTEELDYEHASYRVRGGVRLHPTANARVDLFLVGLQESVDGLPADVMERWERPYGGLEVAYSWRSVRSEQPLISSIDGHDLTVRGEGFLGDREWSRVTLSQQWGKSLGRFHFRQGSSAVLGTGFDFVNASLIGGSWDALGGNAVYGLRYGEIRATNAVTGNAGVDVRFAPNWYVGIRTSAVLSEELVEGYALNVSGTWRTVGFSGGVATVASYGLRESEPLVYAALVVPLHKR